MNDQTPRIIKTQFFLRGSNNQSTKPQSHKMGSGEEGRVYSIPQDNPKSVF